MTAKLFIISAILGLPFMVHGFSDGAPSSQCVAMMPHHMVDPQKAAFPYVISFDKNPIKPGETVGVTIKGKTESDNFKGLLVQARVGNTPIGKFDVSSSAQYLQLMDCGNSKGNAISHKKMSGTGINQVKFMWTSPNNLTIDEVNIVATVAKNYQMFWVAQKSDSLTVK